MYETYPNLTALRKDHPAIAKELLEQVDRGEWEKEELYLYQDLSDYAEYELTEGWYIDLNLDDRDFRGAPNPLDFIDLEALGNALARTWDDHSHFIAKTGEVITTGYGCGNSKISR
ncbi:hypothetical protein BH739_16375 [Enterococcus casseliflavus]|nr:hypothetical protein BH739_16375 [Enterococcus casseliflavus]